MYIEHACQQTQQVWPVEYEDQLTLLTSLESAEQYTHEHGGGNHPRPHARVLRTHRMALRHTANHGRRTRRNILGLVFRF